MLFYSRRYLWQFLVFLTVFTLYPSVKRFVIHMPMPIGPNNQVWDATSFWSVRTWSLDGTTHFERDNQGMWASWNKSQDKPDSGNDDKTRLKEKPDNSFSFRRAVERNRPYSYRIRDQIECAISVFNSIYNWYWFDSSILRSSLITLSLVRLEGVD